MNKVGGSNMKYILDDHESHSTQHGINQEKELLGKDSLNFNENQWKLSQTYHYHFRMEARPLQSKS